MEGIGDMKLHLHGWKMIWKQTKKQQKVARILTNRNIEWGGQHEQRNISNGRSHISTASISFGIYSDYFFEYDKLITKMCFCRYASESVSLACKYAYKNATPGSVLGGIISNLLLLYSASLCEFTINCAELWNCKMKYTVSWKQVAWLLLTQRDLLAGNVLSYPSEQRRN